MLLGGPVGAGQGEDGVGGGAEEAGVDDVAHSGGRGGVDEGPVLQEAVGGFGGGDHEEHVDARQGRARRLAVSVLGDGDLDGRRAAGPPATGAGAVLTIRRRDGPRVTGPPRGAGGVAQQQAQRRAALVQESRDGAADAAGRARDGDECRRAGGGGDGGRAHESRLFDGTAPAPLPCQDRFDNAVVRAASASPPRPWGSRFGGATWAGIAQAGPGARGCGSTRRSWSPPGAPRFAPPGRHGPPSRPRVTAAPIVAARTPTTPPGEPPDGSLTGTATTPRNAPGAPESARSPGNPRDRHLTREHVG